MRLGDRRIEEVEAHYERFIGEPSGVARFDQSSGPAPAPRFVLEYAPESPDYDWVYASLGMSRRSMPAPISDEPDSPRMRAELITLTREQQPELPEALAGLTAYPFFNDTFLADGHTIAGTPGQGIVPGSPLTEIFISLPLFADEEFEVIHHSDGSHTHILWVIPVYTSERLYVRKHGAPALHDLFVREGVAVGDWRRPAAV